MNDPLQPYIIRLTPKLARTVRNRLIHADVAPYQDLSEAVTAALENLLVLHGSDLDPLTERGEPSVRREDVRPLLARPSSPPQAVGVPGGSGEALFVLTNRLNPFALSSRVLVNQILQSGPPDGESFLRVASECARNLGHTLREEDKAAGRSGSERRHVGWPTGDNASKALDRFRWSFLFSVLNDRSEGPLIELGLANVADGKVLPTQEGIQLAIAPSPLLGEVDGWTLGVEQQRLLRAALLRMPAELAEVATFLQGVTDSRGAQRGLDQYLQSAYSAWTANRVTAHRAAMLGRLRDVGVVSTEGRGPLTAIQLTSEGEGFMAEVLGMKEGA